MGGDAIKQEASGTSVSVWRQVTDGNHNGFLSRSQGANMPDRSGIVGPFWSLTGLDGRDFEDCADRGNLFTPSLKPVFIVPVPWVVLSLFKLHR